MLSEKQLGNVRKLLVALGYSFSCGGVFVAVEITNRTITRKELRRHGLKDNYFIEKWYGNTGWELTC